MKAIVIGRHAPTGKEGVEIVGNEDNQGRPQPHPIMFPATAKECIPVLQELVNEARKEDCTLLFQAIPAQLAVAISQLVSEENERMADLPKTLQNPAKAIIGGARLGSMIGAIINIPGPRLTAVSQTYASDDVHAVGAIEAAVRFVNIRAKTEVISPYEIKITVDPFSPFEFSHVQWFDGSISNMSILPGDAKAKEEEVRP